MVRSLRILIAAPAVMAAVAFLVLGPTDLWAQDGTVLGQSDGPVTLAWDAPAPSYRVEVRRDEQVFIDIEQESTELRLNLAPGEYSYRIHVLDPFGKEVSASDWQPLRVERSRIPYFRVRVPAEIWEGTPRIPLTVDAAELRDGTVFRLVSDEAAVDVPWRRAEGAFVVDVASAELEPGPWNLEAIDPSKRRFVHPEALVVRPTRPPTIEATDLRRIPTEGLVPVTVSGEAFDPQMRVEVTGPGGSIPVAALEVVGGTEARIYLDMDDAVPGNYDLVLTNPGGENSRKERALRVEEPITEERIKEQPRLEFQAGFAPMYFETPDGDQVPSLIGVEVAVDVHSGWTQPFLRGLGVESRYLLGVTGPSSESNLEFYDALDLSGYWRPLVGGRVAPIILLGLGNMGLDYTEQYGLFNLLYSRIGIGVDITRERRMTRVGLNALFIFTNDVTVPVISLMFRRGFRM